MYVKQSKSLLATERLLNTSHTKRIKEKFRDNYTYVCTMYVHGKVYLKRQTCGKQR